MLFKNISDRGKVWLFPVKGPVDPLVKEEIERFLLGWQAHGSKLQAGVEILEGQIIAIAVEESVTAATGCSIDSMTNFVEKLCAHRCGGVVRASQIIFWKDGSCNIVDRRVFVDLVVSKEILDDTAVFDSLVDNVAAIRANQWKKQYSSSWHSKLVSHHPL